MKKTFISIAILLLIMSTSLFAQVEKGRWFVSGSSNLGLDVGKRKIQVGSETSDDYKYFKFNLTPQIGYTVIDKLAVGVFFNFEIESYKNFVTDFNSGESKEQYTTFNIGPVARYYFADLKGFMPYGQGLIGFGFGNSKYTPAEGSETTNKMGYFTYQLGVGGTYFVNNNVGFDVFLGYDYDQQTYKANDDSYYTEDIKYKYGSIEFNVGIFVSIGKK
jgi:outer membrane protein